MATDEQIDEAFDNYKDRTADDHVGLYDDDEEAWERRAGAAIDLDDEPTRANNCRNCGVAFYPQTSKHVYCSGYCCEQHKRKEQP